MARCQQSDAQINSEINLSKFYVTIASYMSYLPGRAEFHQWLYSFPELTYHQLQLKSLNDNKGYIYYGPNLRQIYGIFYQWHVT